MSTNKFINVLEEIGKGFEKGLTWAVQYAVPVAKLVSLLFPSVAPEALGVANATQLVQSAVMLVEQKYAASGKQNGTGAQKLAEVTTLVGPTVISLLQSEGISVNTDYVNQLVSAVVGILNVQMALPAATPAS